MNRRRIWIAALIVVIAGAGGVNVSNLSDRVTRLRNFLNQTPAGLYLVVNAPANRLDVFRDGEKIRSFPVSIGRRGFETPPGSYKIDHIVWNPWWHPPESAWARTEKPTPPGPDNPMGRAKLFFGNLLYLHGTPYERQLGEPASHGCVRMANRDVMELAQIVQEYAAPSTTDAIESLKDNPSMSRTIWLKTKVPLSINYDVVEIADGRLQIHPDVYKRTKRSVAEQIADLLAREGFDPTSANPGLLKKLIDKAERRGTSVAMPLDTLFKNTALVSGR